jgi:hypothetical protein
VTRLFPRSMEGSLLVPWTPRLSSSLARLLASLRSRESTEWNPQRLFCSRLRQVEGRDHFRPPAKTLGPQEINTQTPFSLAVFSGSYRPRCGPFLARVWSMV